MGKAFAKLLEMLLRFLLHRCEDDGTSITQKDKELDQSGAWRACFWKLRVLDLSYTDWCWLLSERMMNIINGQPQRVECKGDQELEHK
jgi:hypothetical protein